jgi:hypothetical protein
MIPLLYPALSSLFHLAVYLYSLEIHTIVYLYTLEFIQVFIHALFNFLGHSFEVFALHFIHFSILSVCYTGVVDFWRSYMPLFFHISFVSALGFVHLRPCNWLEILITCSHFVEVFSMFKQDVVLRLMCGSQHCTGG